MLERAKVKPELQKCRFELADAQSLPFEDNSFDAVVSSGTLYYYPEPVVALREQLRVVKPGADVLAMGSLQPKPLFIRVLAETFNRFPTEEQYKGWFEEAGFSNVRCCYISNPWNAQQYALAICGTKATGTAQPARAAPPPPTFRRRIFGLAYLPLTVLRFGVAMAAFAILAPLQILNSARAMRRLKEQKNVATHP
uniref:MPBQ/MBSQ family SAM-binding methyltransferase profile domain-containing protein n=2 Tax=Chrysotila carterae TaxID=13221 RepID=A0A7S4EUX2_CHRCT|mmetsp:Transcript_25234/g.48957  ORF Transcript_25234/g.48957 Transcript_25234/m.48957 type:complete len:196 (-) Transcript_25234:570-1157(-)